MKTPEEVRVGIVLQARMGSTRLPGKVLMPFGHSTLLGWILDRIETLPWPVVVATTDLDSDGAIADFCAARGSSVFRGDEKDVLDRYRQCADQFGFQNVVRLTGDNPFPDLKELERLVGMHLESGADYSACYGELPIGVGMEVFSFAALETSWKEGRAPHHREHVNEYVLENPDRFECRSLSVLSSRKKPDLRLTVDTPVDYEFARSLVRGQADILVTTEELIRRCSSSA